MDVSEIPVVILAGGRGARFDHESQVLPKPLIEVAGKPILQHIIDGFVAQGFRQFIVASGYLGNLIRSHFDAQASIAACPSLEDYNSGVNRFWFYQIADSPVTVTVVDTGEDSHTGERIWRLREMIGDRRFVLTYGDGLCDVDMHELIGYHEHHRERRTRKDDLPPSITVTAVRPPGRFGVLDFEDMAWHEEDNDYIRRFREKGSEDWINGGFMVVESDFFSFLAPTDGKVPELESDALRLAAKRFSLVGYRHEGYWRCMDTRRDKEQIEEGVARNNGNLPWLR